MKINNYIKSIFFIFTLALVSSCFDDLNTVPIDEDIITASLVFDDPDSYLEVLAKLYGGLALSGQQGPAGQADIEGIDEGFGQYLRGYWYHQELTTDEALIGWNDQTIHDFHGQDWTASDGFIFAFYSRIFYQIALCNEYLRETTDEKLDSRGVSSGLKTEIEGFRAEARFLRALSYYHALDLFRNVPFVTEDDIVGSFFPEQTNANDLFAYLESELLEIQELIAPARTNPYGRADQGAVWMLLAKLYLNAEVYIGTPKYAECLSTCEKILNAGYELDPEYRNLFLADNHTAKGIIFPITYDGINTRTWGGTTFVIRAGIGGNMDPTASGVASGWGGTRTTKEFVDKFPGGDGIIVAPTDGNTRSYPKVYVPGSFNDFNAGDTENALSSVNKNRIYEGYRYFADANTELVFTTIPSLSQKLGDNEGDGILESNGANIIVPEPGLYYLQVNLNDNTYLIEKRSISIVGDAAEGWESDVPLEYNEEIGGFRLVTTLNSGGLKFRANNNWDVNYGDTGADAILDLGGDNINIDVPGTYEVTLFLDKPDYTYGLNSLDFDRRAMFHFDGQTREIDDITQFTQGIAINKFKNVTSDGAQGSDTDFPDTDFPMFRLADAYLMASEAILRSGGNKTQALEYFNAVRRRAFQGGAGDISEAELDLPMILDERGRELYWECHRRTDLIRFDSFSQSNYLWQWKGGTQEGQSVASFRDVFPIPSSDIGANPNLEQNEGY